MSPSPKITSGSITPISKSPFSLGDPLESFPVKITTGGKLSQKQRRRSSQRPSTLTSPILPPQPPSIAWSTTIKHTVELSSSPRTICTQKTPQSLRQIQKEQEMFRRQQVNVSPSNKPSLLTPEFSILNTRYFNSSK